MGGACLEWAWPVGGRRVRVSELGRKAGSVGSGKRWGGADGRRLQRAEGLSAWRGDWLGAVKS